MEELVLTHQTGTNCIIAKVNYEDLTVVTKKVSLNPHTLSKLLNSGNLRKYEHNLSPAGDAWLLYKGPGWVCVDSAGKVKNTSSSAQLEEDEFSFLTALIDVPAGSDKSRVFVAKLLYTGERVSLQKEVTPVAKLPPEVYAAFLSMSGVDLQGQDDYEGVTEVELWGRTLNTLYGSNKDLLDYTHLSKLDWLPPQVCYDTLLFRGEERSKGYSTGKFTYLYLKGDEVLYVGHAITAEANFNRYTVPRLIKDVRTYENLLTPVLVGRLEVEYDYLLSHRLRRACVRGERISKEAENFLAEFLLESTLLVSVVHDLQLSGDSIQTSCLYDLVNDKLYIFKSHNSSSLGTYLGEMSVSEWRETLRTPTT